MRQRVSFVEIAPYAALIDINARLYQEPEEIEFKGGPNLSSVFVTAVDLLEDRCDLDLPHVVFPFVYGKVGSSARTEILPVSLHGLLKVLDLEVVAVIV